MTPTSDLWAALLGRRPPRMQVAALCCDAKGRVLLITSRGTGRWVLPKGWPMSGKTLAGAALQEAWEEAGVRGQVAEAEIGRYRYEKAQDAGFSIPVEVRVFRVDVADLAPHFPERSQRRRAWFDPRAAAEQVDEIGLQALLLSI